VWSCNGSASPAVFPERRVLPIVTPWAAADERPLALYRVDVPKGRTSDLLEVMLGTGATRRLSPMTLKDAVTCG